MFKAGHKILGLYDGDQEDAEILVVGPKKKTAIEMGYMDDPQPKATEAADESSESAGSGKKKKGNKTEVGNIALGVPFAQIRMKPALWGWVSLIMPACRTDEGKPYATDNDGVADWIYDVVEWFGRQALSMQYQLDMQSRTIEDIVKRMRDGIQVQAETELWAPDVTETNTQDVTQEMVAMLSHQANAMAQRMAQSYDEDEGDDV